MKAILERIELLLRDLLQEIRFGDRVVAGQAPAPVVCEEWLNKDGVMDLLCITSSTFYRRFRECKWTRKRNGRSWYYLKSSVI